MATSNRDVTLKLSVETLGEDGIKELQKAVEALGRDGGAAAPEFQRLADEIGRLGEQSKALSTFRELSEETDKLASRQAESAASTAQMAAKLQELAAATAQARDRQREATNDLVTGQQAQAKATAALRELKAEYDAAGKNTKDYRDKLLEAVQAQSAANIELVKLRQNQKEANAEVTAAVSEQSKQETQVKKSAAQTDRLAEALQKQTDALRESTTAAEALGVSTEDVATAEGKLLATFNAVGREAATISAQLEILAVEEANVAQQAEELAAALAQQNLDKAAAETAALAQQTKLLEAEQEFATETARHLADAQQRVADEAARLAQVQKDDFAKQLAQAQALLTAEFELQAAIAADLIVKERALADAQRDAGLAAEKAAQDMADAAQKAGQRIDNAFGTLGVRSVQAVQQEIAETRAAMATLAAESQRTGTSMAGAFAAGENEIKTLEREIRELNGTLTLADKSANLFRNSLGQIAAGNLIADAVGSIVEKVKDMGRQFITANLEIERLTRTLTQVTGSTEGAAQKIAFLRDTAQTAGISISSITDSFIRFQASASASGVAASEIDAIFKSVTVAGSKMGLSAERVALSLDALGQIASKGVLSMEELRQQLGDSLPAATAIAAKGLGVTTAQLTKMVESGQVLAGDFFPAFRRGLTETFGSADETVKGLAQSFARLGNEFTKLYQQAQDSTAFKVLGASIDAITNNFTSLVSVVGGVGKAFLGLKLLEYAKTFYAVGAATTKVAADTALHTASVVANSAATAVNTTAKVANIATTKAQAAANAAATATAGAFTASLNVASGAMTSLATGARTLFAALGGLPGIFLAVALNARELGTWIGETVAKWGAAGAAMRKYEQEMAAQAAREKQIAAERETAQAKAFQALQRELQATTEKRKASEANALATQKETAAENTRAEVIESLAALYGEETRSAQAAAAASEIRQAAMEKEAAARAAYVAAIEAEIAETEVLLSQSAVRNEKAEETLKKLKELLAVKKQESAESANAVTATQLETAARRIAAETLKDNSAKVDEYRNAALAAKDTEADLLEMQKQGLPVAEALDAARIKTAEMTRLAADAVKDLIANTKLEYQTKIQNVEATRSALDSEAKLYTQLAANAKSRGDLNMANYYETESKKKSIEASKLAIEIKKIELELEKAELAIKIQSLNKNDALYASRLKELQLRQQMNDIHTKALGAEKELLRLKENEVSATNTLSGALGKEANARDQGTAAMTRENAERQKSLALREQEVSLLEKELNLKDREETIKARQGKTVMAPVDNVPTFNSRDEAEVWLEKFKKDYRTNNNANTNAGMWGTYLYDLAMAEYKAEMANVASKEEVARRQEERSNQKPVNPGAASMPSTPGAPNPPLGTPATSTAGSTPANRTVTVNINGRNLGAVNGLNDQQAAQLTSVLRGLENAQGTAA